MSKYDSPQPQDWSELDRQPEYWEHLKYALTATLLHKKFGKEFIGEYNRVEFGRMLDEEYNDPSIPEVDNLEKRFLNCTNMEELLEAAKSEGATLTQEEIDSAKKAAIESMSLDQQEDDN